jgi:hypothetical protein
VRADHDHVFSKLWWLNIAAVVEVRIIPSLRNGTLGLELALLEHPDDFGKTMEIPFLVSHDILAFEQ